MEFSRLEYWSGSHSLLQGIFPTQETNLGLLQRRQILYHLSLHGSLLVKPQTGTVQSVSVSKLLA